MASPTPDQSLRFLFHLSRLLRDETLPMTSRIEELFERLQEFSFGTPASLEAWDSDSLAHARHFAEEITVLYVSYFYDLSRLPVTYYKREKWIRRHLDSQFSSLFHEIQRRARMEALKELITEEPIYWLLQKAREKSFPKEPKSALFKSKDKRPHLNTLKTRFHLALAERIEGETGSDRSRQVLMPDQL